MTTPKQEDLLLNLMMEKKDLASMLMVKICDSRTALKNSLLSNCNISNGSKWPEGKGEKAESEG